MRGILVVVALGLLGCVAGCQMPSQSTSVGWKFEVGRPSVIAVPAAVTQPGADVQVTPLAAGAAVTAPMVTGPAIPQAEALRMPSRAEVLPLAPAHKKVPCPPAPPCSPTQEE